MTDTKTAWDDVANSLTTLGQQVKAHFDDVVGERPFDRRGVDEALAELRATLDRAYSAAGQAAKDPTVRESASKIGSSFVEALSSTLIDLGQRLKKLRQ
ncbi:MULTISPECIES: hypothetical protein [Protofrankia]|uniref:Uncharacterized protein n=1 Tax=Candidatus Protofrankia datiscae TaxID=2716812 RepID=F8AW65_9ACTN|nr:MULTISPECIES: hypothetical protein [Protofrankia]AEH11392.1 hypothetical protein FsymDg_4121 [Candidatus Protofrankia datiscae]